MGKFKKGDWVRVVDNKGAPYDYRVGDVHKVDAVLAGLVYALGKPGMYAERFEPWQPRVGERVKVTGNDQWAGDGEVTKLRNYGVFVVLMKTGRFAGKPGGFYIRDIEPILTAAAPDKPATLKIEAGRFYKTRDGRKVGPMIEDKWHDRDYGWTVEHEFNAEYGKAWRADGTFHVVRGREHSADLIAEWIDEPAAKPSNDNAKPKFKVGDRVKLARSFFGAAKVGATATIGQRGMFGGFVDVVWDKNHLYQGQMNGGYSPDYFELIPSTPSDHTTIVALIENGQPKPSSTPHVHASIGAAEKEAKRLAAKFKGQQFGVFTLTTTHHEPKPVYDHKWQNMAALGLKIDAIKELRAVAGIPQGHAERIVGQFAA